jgi:protein kinase-like protein/putative peptidoglycan binding protein
MTANDGGAAQDRGAHRAMSGVKPLRPEDPAQVGGFRPVARLGSGGMGAVYLAHTPGGQPVALKVVRPELAEAPDFRRRFEQEVRAARRVQGLYTVPVLEADTEGPVPWLATAYVAGPSLSEAVAAHGPLSEHTVLLLVAGVAEALQSIHAVGVVHRDLKPSNVLLVADGPRVIDFGIARATDATSLTDANHSVIGTPAFMAPEQVMARGVGPQADIFALGLLAHYAATGSGAFGEGDPQALLYRVVHDEPDLSRLPAGLRRLIAACLIKDAAARPTPAQLIEACRELSPDAELRRDRGWLPAVVVEEITARSARHTSAPYGPNRAVPGTPAGGFGPAVGHTPPYPAATPATPAGGAPYGGPWPDRPFAGAPAATAAPASRGRRTRIVVLAAALTAALALLVGGGYAAGLFGGTGGSGDDTAAGSGGGDGAGDADGGDGGDALPAAPGSKPSDDESQSGASPDATEETGDAADPEDTDGSGDTGDTGDTGDEAEPDAPEPSPTATRSATSDPTPTQTSAPDPTESTTSAPDPGAPGRANCDYAADRDQVWAEGHAGESVSEIQCLLKYNYGFDLDVDGMFGPLTGDAVRDVQACSGIDVDGEVGPITWGYLDDPLPSCV